MTRILPKILLVATIVFAMSGCCTRRTTQPKCCPPYEPAGRSIQLPEYEPVADVVTDFDSIPNYETVRRSLFEQMNDGRAVKIDVLEAACIAAANSELAELIEAERHAVLCQANGPRAKAIDIILQGEALEERNLAAGAAAELTLGLVQIHLQRELIQESKLHLAQLEETIQAADDAGFATADGKHELAEGEISVKTAESELNSAEQKLMLQLNLLINIDSQNPIVFRPVYELAPQDLELNVRQQTAIAEADRPGIRALEMAVSGETAGESVYNLLKQMDSRLGIRLAPAPIRKQLLRRQLMELLKQEDAPDATAETRKVQVNRILAARKNAASIAAVQAMLQIQSSLEKLAIVNEDIACLDARHQQLKAKQEIDAEDSYLELNRNWVELQQAKSDRVAAAIEHEAAKFKLLQAQGHLVLECGYDFAPKCDVSNNSHCL